MCIQLLHTAIIVRFKPFKPKRQARQEIFYDACNVINVTNIFIDWSVQSI